MVPETPNHLMNECDQFEVNVFNDLDRDLNIVELEHLCKIVIIKLYRDSEKI